MFKDEIIDTKYEVILVEQSYTDNEYGGWMDGSTMILASYKNEELANAHVEEANEFITKTQRKYRGKISYRVRPMYLREFVTLQWTPSKATEAETQASLAKLFPPKPKPTRNLG